MDQRLILRRRMLPYVPYIADNPWRGWQLYDPDILERLRRISRNYYNPDNYIHNDHPRSAHRWDNELIADIDAGYCLDSRVEGTDREAILEQRRAVQKALRSLPQAGLEALGRLVATTPYVGTPATWPRPFDIGGTGRIAMTEAEQLAADGNPR